MANKRRPKQARPPYKRYVYRSNFTEKNSDDDSDTDEEPADMYGNAKDFSRKTNLAITSTYILTNQHSYRGKVWPRSQFEKVDVLLCCLNNGNEDFDEAVREIELQSKYMALPLEIIVNILVILHQRGKLRPRFLRVCRLFYRICLPLVYENPKLKASNFFQFVDTISQKNNPGEHVRQLDLSYIIQTGKNAYVAKLLKRSRQKLEVFVAPQTSFGLGPLIALKNCQHLRVLDLRLVSETLNLEELFRSIRTLDNLTHLSFPRSSIDINDYLSIRWPPRLTALRISGGITDTFLTQSEFPKSITHLEFSHCPAVHHDGLQTILWRFGHNLTTLKVQYPMPSLRDNSLDPVFKYCPRLTYLEIAVDYVSNSFLDDDNLTDADDRPLRSLFIDSSGMLGTSNKLDLVDLAIALNDNRLPRLKNVSCTAKLGWDPKSEYVSFIVDTLDARGGGLYIGY